MRLAVLVVVLASALAARAEEPLPACETIHSPFADPDRRALPPLKRRVQSPFGANRVSWVKGHKHAGVDLGGSHGEPVFAVCAGRVALFFQAFPHRTVFVEHRAPDGSTFFTGYKHVEEAEVVLGQRVDERTRIGRLFTADEQAQVPWRNTHLHFELRRSIEDEGWASARSMSLDALARFCLDPMPWFGEKLVRAKRPK